MVVGVKHTDVARVDVPKIFTVSEALNALKFEQNPPILHLVQKVVEFAGLQATFD